MLASSLRACVAREFTVFATGRTSPIVGWLPTLAGQAHAECGGPGVGAVGMCFTGGFALGMAVDDRMLAPVLSQPSLPLGPGRARRAAVGFVAVEIDSSPGNPHGIPRQAHSVLTDHLVDEPGHPTRDALDQVLTLLQRPVARAALSRS